MYLATCTAGERIGGNIIRASLAALLCLPSVLSLSAGGMLCKFTSSGCRRYCKLKGYSGGHCEHGGCQCQEVIHSLLMDRDVTIQF